MERKRRVVETFDLKQGVVLTPKRIGFELTSRFGIRKSCLINDAFVDTSIVAAIPFSGIGIVSIWKYFVNRLTRFLVVAIKMRLHRRTNGKTNGITLCYPGLIIELQ